MEELTDQLYAEMINKLDDIARSSTDNLKRAELSYNTVQSVLAAVKNFIITYDFDSSEEEILFFKVIKPRFLKELIYYMEVYHLEAERMPVGDKETQAAYYRHAMERISIFFERNHQFYTYYRAGKTNQDDIFFRRETEPLPQVPEYFLDMDTKFCTLQSFRLAKMQAFEMLNNYIQNSIYSLYNEASNPENSCRPKCKWTDPKVSLTEMGYAIHASGAVDNGNADIKEIMAALEFAFNVDLGNYYAVFNQNIRIRKKNRTVFMDHSKEKLNNYMDGLDENPRGY